MGVTNGVGNSCFILTGGMSVCCIAGRNGGTLAETATSGGGCSRMLGTRIPTGIEVLLDPSLLAELLLDSGAANTVVVECCVTWSGSEESWW